MIYSLCLCLILIGILDKAASWAVWGLLGGYIGWVYLSPAAPGNPAWNTAPETIQVKKLRMQLGNAQIQDCGMRVNRNSL